ncbi:unnamed protein product [Vitrella brassicaformis CCMP3155]|uniref:Uncharacterized protein n=1 Tax=Vitrella brassicaformis (strain CCMP3155) TaxID=1169540 RepID=A0A0G4EN37_VITBC|nr:unnamed protein product [Vitrella brassicaformis CCMP3155]|eukprot:CEL98443.1 unnamed protein product [Vitrella brassicaformis CCMP3155]
MGYSDVVEACLSKWGSCCTNTFISLTIHRTAPPLTSQDDSCLKTSPLAGLCCTTDALLFRVKPIAAADRLNCKNADRTDPPEKPKQPRASSHRKMKSKHHNKAAARRTSLITASHMLDDNNHKQEQQQQTPAASNTAASALTPSPSPHTPRSLKSSPQPFAPSLLSFCSPRSPPCSTPNNTPAAGISTKRLLSASGGGRFGAGDGQGDGSESDGGSDDSIVAPTPIPSSVPQLVSSRPTVGRDKGVISRGRFVVVEGSEHRICGRGGGSTGVRQVRIPMT